MLMGLHGGFKGTTQNLQIPSWKIPPLLIGKPSCRKTPGALTSLVGPSSLPDHSEMISAEAYL